MTIQVLRFSRVMTLGVWTSGTQTSVVWGNEKPFGMTPINVVGVPFNRIVRPMIDGSLAYRRSQKR